jgi:hypothetical protein
MLFWKVFAVLGFTAGALAQLPKGIPKAGGGLPKSKFLLLARFLLLRSPKNHHQSCTGFKLRNLYHIIFMFSSLPISSPPHLTSFFTLRLTSNRSAIQRRRRPRRSPQIRWLPRRRTWRSRCNRRSRRSGRSRGTRRFTYVPLFLFAMTTSAVFKFCYLTHNTAKDSGSSDSSASAPASPAMPKAGGGHAAGGHGHGSRR